MSDTPRTDALLAQFGINTEGRDHDPPFAELARTLERELTWIESVDPAIAKRAREVANPCIPAMPSEGPKT